MLADRMRRHSVEHAKEIAQQYFYRSAYESINKATGPRKRSLGQDDIQVMIGPNVGAVRQIIEFLEVPVVPGEAFAGVAWPIVVRLLAYCELLHSKTRSL